MDKCLDLEGRRYPFQGTTPSVGDVLAGFIVKRVTDAIVYLGFPTTPEEEEASRQWMEERVRR